MGCLFVYFLFVSLATAIGVILFAVAATKHKPRERDDRPYDHRFVIDIYNRYLNQPVNASQAAVRATNFNKKIRLSITNLSN